MGRGRIASPIPAPWRTMEKGRDWESRMVWNKYEGKKINIIKRCYLFILFIFRIYLQVIKSIFFYSFISGLFCGRGNFPEFRLLAERRADEIHESTIPWFSSKLNLRGARNSSRTEMHWRKFQVCEYSVMLLLRYCYDIVLWNFLFLRLYIRHLFDSYFKNVWSQSLTLVQGVICHLQWTIRMLKILTIRPWRFTRKHEPNTSKKKKLKKCSRGNRTGLRLVWAFDALSVGGPSQPY